MGLDITAYEYVEKSENDRGDFIKYNIKDFAERGDDLVEDAWYWGSGATFTFLAGSYLGYGAWQSRLCEFVHGMTHDEFWKLEDAAGKVFAELLNYAGNEGVIGPKTSAKLAADFEAWHERFVQENDEYDVRVYVNFMRAFQIAKDTGAVRFG